MGIHWPFAGMCRSTNSRRRGSACPRSRLGRAPGGHVDAEEARVGPPEHIWPFRDVIPDDPPSCKAESRVLGIVKPRRVHKVRRLVGATRPAVLRNDRINDRAPVAA